MSPGKDNEGIHKRFHEREGTFRINRHKWSHMCDTWRVLCVCVWWERETGEREQRNIWIELKTGCGECERRARLPGFHTGHHGRRDHMGWTGDEEPEWRPVELKASVTYTGRVILARLTYELKSKIQGLKWFLSDSSFSFEDNTLRDNRIEYYVESHEITTWTAFDLYKWWFQHNNLKLFWNRIGSRYFTNTMAEIHRHTCSPPISRNWWQSVSMPASSDQRHIGKNKCYWFMLLKFCGSFTINYYWNHRKLKYMVNKYVKVVYSQPHKHPGCARITTW